MLFYEVADEMLKIRGISLERLIYCLGVVVCAWLIQQGVFNNMAIYVPLLGWSFTEKETVLIYYLLLFGNMLVFLFAKGRSWDLCDLLLLAAFPFQIFVIALFSNYLVKAFLIAGFVLFLCTVWEGVRLYQKTIHAKRHERRLRIGNVLRRALGKLHYRTGIILLGCLCYIYVGPMKYAAPWTFLESTGIKGESHKDAIRDVEGALWDSNQEGLKNLRQEVFANLSLEEKVKALQFILDLEMVYWGCDSVQLIAQDFDDPTLGGYYNNKKRIVAINDDRLEKSVSECIWICLHEGYHVYQYACIEKIDWDHVDKNFRMYKEIANWKYEFEHYNSGIDTSIWEEYEKYAEQEVEKTAREYANEWYKHYCYYIENLTD